MQRPIFWVPVFLVLAACTSHTPPGLSAITPRSTGTGVAVDAVIDGSAFARSVLVDLDRPSQSTVNQTFLLTLGDVALEQVDYVDEAQLHAHVPGTLSAGTWALSLVDPFGRTATLPDAFTVTDLPVPVVKIENGAGGVGTEVGDVQVRIGQRVGLFSVARLPDGSFSADVTTGTWILSGVGAITATTGAMVSWSSNVTGAARVQVTDPGLGMDVTGTLTAVPCTQASDCTDPCTTAVSCVAGVCQSGAATLDADGDGFIAAICPGGTDCDDHDASVHPGAREGPAGDPTCSDGRDNDCDGLVDLAEAICGPNSPPVPRLTLSPGAVTVGATVTGSSAGTADAQDPPGALTYDWDWDGDGVYEAQGVTSSHAFATAGPHVVALRVTDTQGAAAVATATAQVVANSSDVVTVTTGVDEANPAATPASPGGTGLSLREAVVWATATAGVQTIIIPAGMTVALTSTLTLTDVTGISILGTGAVIDGAGIAGAGAACLVISGQNLSVGGLEIKSCPGWPIDAHGQSCVVTGCKVHDNGLGVEWAGTGNTFGPGNEVYANGSYGIEVDAAGVVVGDIFRNTVGTGISLTRNAGGSSIVGNMLWNNDSGIVVANQCDGLKIWHNTVYASANDGMQFSPASKSHDLRNNIITGSGQWGLNAKGSSFTTIDANDLFSNNQGACRACTTLGPAAQAVAPGFVNAATRDLRLVPSSPLVNAGVDTGADRNGPAPGNFNGSAPDIGAFEVP